MLVFWPSQRTPFWPGQPGVSLSWSKDWEPGCAFIYPFGFCFGLYKCGSSPACNRPACYSWLNTHLHTLTDLKPRKPPPLERWPLTPAPSNCQLPGQQFSKLARCARNKKYANLGKLVEGVENVQGVGEVGWKMVVESGRRLTGALSCAKHSLNIFCNSSSTHEISGAHTTPTWTWTWR